ncbi:MAG: DUF5016 domain-containing protein [Prevotellaceae bacterium]|jgi:hypothetical protein|nr:DUF5016 domain-containing protein [Prevotellaceae bacterium]
MKTINRIISLCALSILFFTACEKDEDAIPNSVPVIETASITPNTFTFGDSVTITAKISDAIKSLSVLDVQAIINGRTVSIQKILLDGNIAQVNQKIFIPLIDNVSDNTPVSFVLKAANSKNSLATTELTGFTGNRPYFARLYLAVENGGVYQLTPQAGNRDNYEILDVVISKSFTYKIAQKITADNKIDYTGLVWGSVNGKVQMVNESEDGIFGFASGADYTSSVIFNNYNFKTSFSGNAYSTPNLLLENFTETNISGEEFYTLDISLTEGEEIALYNELAAMNIVYNMDFFDRINANKVKFLGITGDYTLYYNKTRQHVVLLPVTSPSYPDYLLITGGGLGYPSKIAKEHTWWGFGNIRDFILTRKIAANVYQATFYIHEKDDGWVAFKIYENTGWGGEKFYNDFTYTGLTLEGESGNPASNIFPSAEMGEGVFRLTINLNTNIINVSRVTLP